MFFTITFVLSIMTHTSAIGSYDDGDGSPEFPFQIAEPNQLIYMSQHPEHWDKHFIVTANINLALADPNTFTTALIAPDGSNGFTGVFDGNGHTISNLTIDTNGEGNDYLGLFGMFSSSSMKVKNLGLKNVTVTGGNGSEFLGALCGCIYGGNIINCYAIGSVGSGGDSWKIGGLCGYNHGSIRNCYAIGVVTGRDGSEKLGGLCGMNSSSINNCYASVSVSGNNYVGGLCGGNDYYSVISNCYASGSVIGINYVGGLCGRNRNSISNCFASGSISGNNYFGGLCGKDYGSISNCYFLDIAGPNNGYGHPLDDPNMRRQCSFIGWDFVNETVNGTSSTWIINTGEYPSLYFFDQTFKPYAFTGQGTNQNPYLIYDPNDLGAIWQQPDRYYRLQNDLDLAGIMWSVAVIPDFAGVLDGNNHTISNLNISGSGHLGLMGVTRSCASVNNLGLENVNVSGGVGSYFLGGLCGQNYGDISTCYANSSISGGNNSYCLGGLCGMNYYQGYINNCHTCGLVAGNNYLGGLCGGNTGDINNCYSTSSITGGDYFEYLGGLCGAHQSGSINNSSASGSVTGGNGSLYLGGLCGQTLDGDIFNCFSSGSVNGENDSLYLGGFCGQNLGGYIINCFSSSSVNGGKDSKNLGGLFGWNSGGSIYNCYATGSVTGGDDTSDLGGLCGVNYNGFISNCYAVGSVSGRISSSYIGGLIGDNNLGSINNCYAVGSVNAGDNSNFLGGLLGRDTDSFFIGVYFLHPDDGGGPINGYGTPLSDPNMRVQDSFVGWDFVGDSNGTDDYWRMCVDGVHYPHLAWQYWSDGDFACPDGVQMADFAYFAERWRDENCSETYNCDGADLNRSGTIDLLDLYLFCEKWLIE